MMRHYSRFIPGEEIGEVEPWRFGTVGVPGVLLGGQKKVMSDETELLVPDAVRQAGFAEGFVQGHAQAVLETQKQISDYIDNEGREHAASFAQLMASVQEQLTNAEQVLANGVMTLACEIARQILHQEISVNVEAVKPVIAQGLTLLTGDVKKAKIKLNPFDYDELKDRLAADFEPLILQLVSDSSVSCGGCLIESSDTIIDGTIEKRWSRTLASLGLRADWSHDDEA
jgi:flagellar assembly protein FliH